MKKCPLVLPYIHTYDHGTELRYSLRSFDMYAKNFNGQIYVIGDRETWFKGIDNIRTRRLNGKTYQDQVYKMLLACNLPDMPSKFIASMDDLYLTEPQSVRVYYIGELQEDNSTLHKRTKTNTKLKLEEMGLPTLDYEAHYPMLVDKAKLRETLNLIKDEHGLQWRSMYGNMWGVEAELVEDHKTKTKNLKDGAIISTHFYTDELDNLFPLASKYES
jgi:hypothetical protein